MGIFALIARLDFLSLALRPGELGPVGQFAGIPKARADQRFKQEREAWTSAVWALGQAERIGKEMWVEIETVEQTPDNKVHFIDQSKGYNSITTLNIEVVDWVPQVRSPIAVDQREMQESIPKSLHVRDARAKRAHAVSS
jgi:hypothetical protein